MTPSPSHPPCSLTLAGAAGAPPTCPTLTLDEALDEVDRQSLTLVQARSRADEAGRGRPPGAAAAAPHRLGGA